MRSSIKTVVTSKFIVSQRWNCRNSSTNLNLILSKFQNFIAIRYPFLIFFWKYHRRKLKLKLLVPDNQKLSICDDQKWISSIYIFCVVAKRIWTIQQNYRFHSKSQISLMLSSTQNFTSKSIVGTIPNANDILRYPAPFLKFYQKVLLVPFLIPMISYASQRPS